jgi:hypothetical protein
MRQITTALFFVLASSAGATEPCREVGGCIDEASASLIVPLDLVEQRCTSADPVRSDAYRNAVRVYLHSADEKFLDRLRASSVYAEVWKKMDEKLNKMDEQSLVKNCHEFLDKQ